MALGSSPTSPRIGLATTGAAAGAIFFESSTARRLPRPTRSCSPSSSAKANGEATLHKHLESIVEVVPQLFAIGSYHVNTDLGTCSCPYYIYTGKQCKHIVAIALLQGLADDSYPTWLRCISPTIFCDPTVFSDNDEGRCEALGITGPPGRPPTLEPRPRRRRKNQLLQHRAGSGDVDLHGGGGSGPGRIEATSHT